MAAKKKPAPKKKAAPKKKGSAVASVARIETFPEGEEGIDLVCAAKRTRKARVEALGINPTGRFVIAGDEEGGCRVIDIERGELRSLSDAEASVHTIAFIDREVALVGDAAGLFRVVDLRTGAERVAFKSGSTLTRVAASAGSVAYGHGDGGAYLWRDGDKPRKIDGVDGHAAAFAFDETQEHVLASVFDDDQRDTVAVHVCNTNTQRAARVRALSANAVGFVSRILVASSSSSNGPIIVAVTRSNKAWGTVLAWDASDKLVCQVSLKGFTGVDWCTVLDDASSTSLRLRVACAQADKIAVVDVLQGMSTVLPLSPWIVASEGSAHGNRCVLLGYDDVAIYDVAAGNVVLERKSDVVDRAALSSDRATFAVCNDDGDVSAYRAHLPR